MILTKEMIEWAAEQNRKGYTLRYIAKKLFVDPSTLSKAFRRNGIKVKRNYNEMVEPLKEWRHLND